MEGVIFLKPETPLWLWPVSIPCGPVPLYYKEQYWGSLTSRFGPVINSEI